MTARVETVMVEVGGAIAPLLDSVVESAKGKLSKVGESYDKLKKQQEKLSAIKGNESVQQLGKAFASSAKNAKTFTSGIGFAINMGKKLASVNAITAGQAALAKSLGVSAKGLETWEGVAQGAGLKAGSVGKFMNEMSNKIGKSKQLGNGKPFGGALKKMGLSFKDIEKMSPEQKFKTITSALKKLDDADLAKSLGKQVFGGDSSQFVGHIRTLSGSMDEIYNKQAKQSLLTEEGRQGAEKYSDAMGSIGTVVSSASAEFSGLIGGALEPYVATLAPKIGALFNEHRDDIKKFGKMLGEALPKIGEFAFSLLNVMTSIGSTVLSVTDAVGGFGTVAAIVGSVKATKFLVSGYQMASSLWGIGKAVAPLVSGALPYLSSMFMSVGTTISLIASTVFPALIAGIKAVGLAVMSNPITAIIGLAVLAVGRLIYAWDDLKKSFKEGGILGAAATFFGIGGDDEEEEKKTPFKPNLTSSVGTQSDVWRRQQDESCHGNYAYTGGHATQTVNARSLPLMPSPSSNSVESNQNIDNRNITINVHATEGQSPKEIAQETFVVLNNDAGVLYDAC
ncbi:phage tail tape measure protein [Halodesulfovibrio sp. MK-HDV]|uniref:phage tail tape measure protein n=1 Tax=Halodesulfovibrio sp. MK-HDV TaxID=2599925 RepID=UPI00136B0ED6|nr:phage tail tape measure protein [Halodesulfovibrio sp. MK-HDV]KAF1075911.1 hypothetical protein MKHDV_01709 [Halodesulfovibrio sp. MK-HDV]